MELIKHVIDIFLHLDVHLSAITAQYGIWTYAILFLIIFCETGLVVTPFLPGDSLLFAIGNLAALGALDLQTLLILLIVAAILGDSVNYGIGNHIGAKAFSNGSRIFKKEYLERTERFYAKYGGKTIIFARFVPIIRTFAPFIAGVGSMSYARFIIFNITGAVAWIATFTLAGYLFGSIPVIRKNFTIIILAIIVISILPGMIEYLRHKRRAV
ncbi:MAG: DedA family protein [Deltaproteobacteria bacterium]|nr:DedA family protein [Deltaproteobacteria bacterium]